MVKRKDKTVKECNEHAKEAAKSAEKAGVCIMEEVRKLLTKEEHSIQPLLAYARQLDKLTGGKFSKKKEEKADKE